MQEQSNYDYFLSQEDDVSASQRAIRYFVKHTRQFEQNPSFNTVGRLLPSFFSYERIDQVSLLDWRLRQGKIVKISGKLFFEHSKLSTPAQGARAYMIPRSVLSLLPSITNVSGWLDPGEIKGEFNPLVGTATFLLPAYRLLIPLEDWREGAVHHLPNKYAELLLHQGTDEQLFLPIEEIEMSSIFTRCEPEVSGSGVAADCGAVEAITFDGDCRACLNRGKDTSFESMHNLPNRTFRPGQQSLHVVFSCEMPPN